MGAQFTPAQAATEIWRGGIGELLQDPAAQGAAGRDGGEVSMGLGEVVRGLLGPWNPVPQRPVSEPSHPGSIAYTCFRCRKGGNRSFAPHLFPCLVLFPPPTSCLSFLNCFPHPILLLSITARGRVAFLGGPTFIPVQDRQGQQISQDLLCTKPGLRYPWVPSASNDCLRSTTMQLGKTTQDERGWGSFSSVGLPAPSSFPCTVVGTEPGSPGPASSWML